MYKINNKKIKGKTKDELSYNGFIMPTKKGFSIDGDLINNINIVNKKVSNKIVSNIVSDRFDALIEKLTELFVSDSEDGSNYREVLDRIEKFRLIIKNKYREYLGKKELEMMSNKLKLLQKEAFKKLLISNEVNVLGKNNYRGK